MCVLCFPNKNKIIFQCANFAFYVIRLFCICIFVVICCNCQHIALLCLCLSGCCCCCFIASCEPQGSPLSRRIARSPCYGTSRVCTGTLRPVRPATPGMRGIRSVLCKSTRTRSRTSRSLCRRATAALLCYYCCCFLHHLPPTSLELPLATHPRNQTPHHQQQWC